MIKIDIDDKKFHRDMQRFAYKGSKKAQNTINKFAVRILAEAQKTLRKRGKIASSQLINSGVIETGDGYADVKFKAKHASIIEFGRKAGTFPNINALRQWVKRKLRITDEKEIKNVAFLIGRKIKNEGFSGIHFLGNAFKRNKNKLINIMKNEITSN